MTREEAFQSPFGYSLNSNAEFSMRKPEAVDVLQPWCSKDHCRMHIMKPFALDGWLYATDGRVIIRTGTDAPDNCHSKIIQSVRELKFGVTDSKLQPWPSPAIVTEDVSCEECKGTGKDYDYCLTCDGTGKTECHECGSEISCTNPTCRKGYVWNDKPCRVCGGSSKVQQATDLRICNTIISGEYAALVNAVPGDKVFSLEHPGQITIHTTDGKFAMLVMAKRED